MKKLLLLVSVIFLSFPAIAQLTTVSGNIVDSDGTSWFSAKVTATFVPNPSYPQQSQYNINGVPITSATYNQYLNQTLTADASGHFAITLLDNSLIAPVGSSWKFTIQSYTSAPSSTFPNLLVSGATQNVSAFILANITAPRFSAISSQFGASYGYSTVEVATTPVPGGSFFNVTTNQVNVWGCNASGCSWLTQAIGSFCSTTSCTFSGPLFAPQFNNICEASLQTGADFEAQINACAAQSYMAQGGIITTFGYGGTTVYGTTQLTALSNAAQPISLWLNPATTFVFNNNAGTASTACLVPINNGSSIVNTGFVPFTHTYNFQLGPSAVTYDFVCNAKQDGTQEGFRLDGLTLDGNSSATMAGSLLHLKNIFVGTRISNLATYHPFGNAVTIDNGGDIIFDNIALNDSATSGGYPGNVLTLNCPNHVSFYGGAIQNNGIFNPLIVMNSNNSLAGGCNPSGGGGYQPVGVKFYNVDVEIVPATIGSFTGHATNVDPIQIYDPTDVKFDGLFVYGNRGTGQIHVIDIYSTNAGAHGPIEIHNMNALYPQWGVSDVLINNTISGVPTSLAAVHGTFNSGAQIGIGTYRWEGGLTSNFNVTDYVDNENIANATLDIASIPPLVYSALPTCNSSYEGHMATITDSTVKTWGSTVLGGGSYHVKVYCNSGNWTVDAGGPTTTSNTLTQAVTTCASGCTNTQTICSTTGLAWQGGACTMTIPWPQSFADNLYSAECHAFGVVSGQQTIAFVSSKAVNQVTVYLESPTAVVTTAPEIDCVGVHN